MLAPQKPTRQDLQAEVTLTEQMARQSENYARRDPAQKRGALVARSRARDAKLRLANFDAVAKPAVTPPTIDELLTYDQTAGEIASIAFVFRCGEADQATQKALSAKLACLARAVRKLERFVQEASENADDQPEGVPYNGKPSDV